MSKVPDGFQPETIVDQPVPLLNGAWTDANGNNSNGALGGLVITPPDIPDVVIPKGVIASEIISSSLNTATRKIKGSYNFEQMGAIEIGQILISPAGILATDSGGNTTISVDASTGNVTLKGTLAAGSVVTGYLAVGTAATDVNSGSTTIDGGRITTGSVTASQIQAGTITSTQISGSYIYAGVINASQINAGTMSANRISGGTIDATNINVANLNADHITSGMLPVPIFTSSATTSFIKTSGTTGGLRIASAGGSIGSDALQVLSLRVDNSSDLITTGYLSSSQGVYLNGHFLQNGNSNGQIKIDGTNKSAIVKTSDGYRALYCAEAPEVWFFDFCKGGRKFTRRNTWRFWKWGFENMAYPDKMFLEVSVAPYIIMPTMNKGIVQIWAKRKGHETLRFEKKTKKEFEKNEKFLKMAKVYNK